MDLGHIIFIGLIVVVVISNLVRTAKKAQTSQPKPLVGRPLEEAVVIQKQQAQAISMQRQKNKPKSVKPISVPSSPMFIEGERQFEEQPIEILQTDVGIGIRFNFSDREEIQKGIIFSEIFNRKYE